MAKKSQLARDKKRREMHAKHQVQRADLKAKLRESWDNPQARWEIQVALQKLPRNSSPSRLKNRCEVTGRSRGYMRKFGLSRITFREMASQGLLPGIRKSSW
ncbi:MAG: small subunit ribosomal protein S14 [Chloroflexi bacterium]|nr:MAG: small subunit ribosomal protein S14 [Chloroflexota bacterium]